MWCLFLCPSFSLSDTKVILTFVMVVIIMIMAFTYIMVIGVVMTMATLCRVATANRPGPDHLVFTIRDVFKEKFAHNFGKSSQM